MRNEGEIEGNKLEREEKGKEEGKREGKEPEREEGEGREEG